LVRALLGLIPERLYQTKELILKKNLNYLRYFDIINSMRGLCHICLTSNVELVVKKGKILCNECHNKLKEK